MTLASSLDLRDRNAIGSALEAAPFDLLVIGGGITGAGIARDAAMRGLSVALIEAADFASGTSSRSSKMIHGGLRYLAQGEVGLVREAATERKILRRIAPHLTEPCWFTIPSRSLGETAKLKAALIAFEALGGVDRANRHRVLSLAELAEQEPLMRREGLHRGLIYREYLTDDARLTLANVRAAQAAGAVVANYLAATAVTGGTISEVHCRSTLPLVDGEYCIRAQAVVNAAGPWVDAVRRAEDSRAGERLALSKGVHLVFDRATLPVNNTVIINTPDKRAVFAVPRGAFTYLGTTDDFYPDADYWPRVDASDADYLLTAARAALDAPRLCQGDIVSVWSGVRPLVKQEGKAANEISRKDEVWTGPSGMISIAGGKLSAYRAMAARIVDMVVDRLAIMARPCPTDQEPLPGGEAAAMLPDTLDPVVHERLARLYGSEAGALLAEGGDVRAEARRAVLIEGAMRLDDVWVRRSGRAWFDDNAGLDSLPAIAEEMGTLLGWSATQREMEIANCRGIDRQSRAGLTPAARS